MEMDYACSFGLSLLHAMVAMRHTECQKQTADGLDFLVGPLMALSRHPKETREYQL